MEKKRLLNPTGSIGKAKVTLILYSMQPNSCFWEAPQNTSCKLCFAKSMIPRQYFFTLFYVYLIYFCHFNLQRENSYYDTTSQHVTFYKITNAHFSLPIYQGFLCLLINNSPKLILPVETSFNLCILVKRVLIAWGNVIFLVLLFQILSMELWGIYEVLLLFKSVFHVCIIVTDLFLS